MFVSINIVLYIYIAMGNCYHIETEWRLYASGTSVIFGSGNDLSPFSAPSHYLNQSWCIVNCTLRVTLREIPIQIVLFHNDFPEPSGEKSEHRISAHGLQQPTASCIAIFHKYCCCTKCGGVTTDLILRSHWWYVTDVSKCCTAGIWSMD